MLKMLRASGAKTRIALTLVFVVLAAAVILACGSASANSGTSTSGNSSTSSSSSKHFKAGDQVNVGGTYVVTVNSIKTSPGDDISQPKAGDQFIVIDVTIKNVSSQQQNLSSILQFTLKDATGQKYDETILSGDTPPDGQLAAGDIVRGQLAYEVPTAQKSFTLAFQADITSNGETVWDLSL